VSQLHDHRIPRRGDFLRAGPLFRTHLRDEYSSATVPFELQPILIGDLVELRPLRAEDFPVLYAVASDPLIWEQHPEPDRCTEPVFRKFFAGAMDSGGAFLVFDRRDGRVIGSSRFAGYDEARSEIEIGWTFLARSHWGGLYNREMKRLMLDHAFRFVNRVIFRVGPDNTRSQRAMEKIGGVSLGLQSHPERGDPVVVYEITRT
jgi:RimJ/RimL family protein N-acetyltransferase